MAARGTLAPTHCPVCGADFRCRKCAGQGEVVNEVIVRSTGGSIIEKREERVMCMACIGSGRDATAFHMPSDHRS